MDFRKAREARCIAYRAGYTSDNPERRKPKNITPHIENTELLPSFALEGSNPKLYPCPIAAYLLLP